MMSSFMEVSISIPEHLYVVMKCVDVDAAFCSKCGDSKMSSKNLHGSKTVYIDFLLTCHCLLLLRCVIIPS